MDISPPPPVGPAPPPAAPPASPLLVTFPVPWGRLGWGAVLVMAAAAGLTVAYQVRPITVPLLVALGVSYALNPAVSALARRAAMGRTLATCLVLGALGAVGGVLVVLVAPRLAHEMGQIPDKLQLLLRDARPTIEQQLKMTLPTSLDALIQTLQQGVANVDHDVARAAGDMARTVFGGTVSVVTQLASFLLVPFFTFFMLRDAPIWLSQLRRLVPLPYRATVHACLVEIDATLSAFVRGQLIVAAVLALTYAIGLTLVGLPLGFAVGIMTGLGNVVPYLGISSGLFVATAFTLLSWQGLGHLMAVYGVFLVCHTLDGWLISPRILGNSVGLSAGAIIVAILVFGQLMGFFGILAAVPLLAVLRILGRMGLAHYEASSLYRGGVVGRERG